MHTIGNEEMLSDSRYADSRLAKAISHVSRFRRSGEAPHAYAPAFSCARACFLELRMHTRSHVILPTYVSNLRQNAARIDSCFYLQRLLTTSAIPSFRLDVGPFLYRLKYAVAISTAVVTPHFRHIRPSETNSPWVVSGARSRLLHI